MNETGGKPRTLAARHYCSLRDERGAGWRSFHTARNGKPRSKTCTYCHGRLVVEAGLWGLFVWAGNGDYPESAAVKTFTSESAAQRWQYAQADKSYVVRWIVLDA
jgi:hypothetical protein